MPQPAKPIKGISSLTQIQTPAEMVITFNNHICYISLQISLLLLISELTRITRSQTSKKSDNNEEESSPDFKPKKKKPKKQLDLSSTAESLPASDQDTSAKSIRKSLRKRNQ